MSRLRVLLMTALLAACHCGGTETVGLDSRALGLTVRPSSIDLGRLPRGMVATTSIEVQFTSGPDDLVLEVESSGSTAIRPQAQSLRLRRGQVGRLPVSIDARGADASLSGSVVFAAGSTLAEVRVQAVAVSPAITADELDLGVVPLGARVPVQIDLSNRTDVALTVAPNPSAESGLSFTASSAEDVQLAPEDRAVLQTEVTCLAHGSVDAGLDLPVVGCPSCEISAVRIRGTCVEPPSLAMSPGFVDFGSALPGSARRRQLTVTNDSPLPLGKVHFAIAGGEGAFAVVGETEPLEVGADSQALVEVQFVPARVGEVSATLQALSADGTLLASSALRGHGGGPVAEISPSAVDFGLLSVSERASRTVTISNRGDEPLVLEPATTLTPFVVQSPQPITIDAGQSASLRLSVDGAAPGHFQGALVIRSNAVDRPEAAVGLTATVVDDRQCRLVLAGPQTLDFGALASDAAALETRVGNAGATPCLILAPTVSGTGASAFRVPPDQPVVAQPRLLLAPAEETPIRVEARGRQVAAREASLSVSAVSTPGVDVPLRVRAPDVCLRATPSPLRFPPLQAGCPQVVREILLTETCGGWETLVGVRLGGVSGAQLTHVSTTSDTGLPQPFTPLRVGIGATGSAPGNHRTIATLTLTNQREVTVGVEVPVEVATEKVARFLPRPPAVDVLFVLDNSGSMQDDLARVVQALSGFIHDMVAQPGDFHIALTKMLSTPLGAFFADDQGIRVYDRALAAARSSFSYSAAGYNSASEKGLETLRAALDVSNPANAGLDFLRADARLVVVLVSDEIDQSDSTVAAYVDAVRALKQENARGDIDAVAVTLPPSIDAVGRYRNFAAAFGGDWIDIQSADWSTALSGVTTRATQPRLTFGLDGPADPARVSVRVNGANVPPRQGGLDAWHYDAGREAIVFAPEFAPDPLTATVEIHYWPVCP